MATDKTAVKAYPRKARQPNVLALGLDVSASGGTLESTVLAMLSSARAATQLKTPSTAARSRLKSPSAKSKPPQSLAAPGRATPPEDIDLAKLATLRSYSRKLNEGLHQQGWMQVKTLRFRPKGENIDRRSIRWTTPR